MSLHLPARRIAYTTRTAISKPSLHLQYLLPRTQRRNAWFSWGDHTPTKSALSQELTKRERQQRIADKMVNRTRGTTIFDEELKDPERKQKDSQKPERDARSEVLRPSRVREHMERALDPDPRWRVRYQKKKIAQMVRAGGKLTREQRLRLTEKETTSASPFLPTSTKKLVHLSHQIAGKTVDDAITQMRFSKKKMAREVKWQLEEARAKAIASRGMGLGAVNGETLDQPRKIQTKDGRWIEISDPTTMYVDQSWVNRGPYRAARVNYHARGRMSLMWRPTASISLVLKEEKTRIRQHEERVEKQAKKAPWVHLPNRPVTAQRQHYSW
ncbi:ribosomal protein L22 [Xylariaceae sp. FL0662B]|nr:ribosomal protein L22 [Xylariaceae sp. FL0662B]